MKGWLAPTKIETAGKVVNLHAVLVNPDTYKALEKLNHEPGKAAIVYTEAREALEGEVVGGDGSHG